MSGKYWWKWIPRTGTHSPWTPTSINIYYNVRVGVVDDVIGGGDGAIDDNGDDVIVDDDVIDDEIVDNVEII